MRKDGGDPTGSSLRSGPEVSLDFARVKLNPHSVGVNALVHMEDLDIIVRGMRERVKRLEERVLCA
jgi:hypothetical protein